MSFAANSVSEEILRATNRWKILWDATLKKDATAKVQPPAFTMHAVEIWWLLRKMIEVTRCGDRSERYISGIAFMSVKELNSFIHKVNSVKMTH